jgi:hypothetical protein
MINRVGYQKISMFTWLDRLSGKKVSAGPLMLNVCFFSFAASLGSILSGPCAAAVVSSSEVWKKSEELGRKNDLDPLLIYSIACAESSLDDKADSGKARGIMQVSRVAWTEVTKQSYDEAWKWETNMEVAAQYLHVLRRQLENSGHYSWPVLAASYHYGPNKVADARFRIKRLPRENNKIYKALLAGRMPKLPGNVPYREIDRPAAIQAFARAEPNFSIVMPILEVAEYEEIPDEVPDVLEIVPLTPFQEDAKIWIPDEMDGLDESQILEPLFFRVADFIAPLVEVPDLESLFVIKNLDLIDNKLMDTTAFADTDTPVTPLKEPEEKPPEVVVIEPAGLDTSLGGIVKPGEAADKPREEARPDVPPSKTPETKAPETVAKPEPLDTSVDGIVKPEAGDDAAPLGIPNLKRDGNSASEE